MYIKKVEISNFRMFEKKFVIDNINIPDKENKGSGLTVLLGENGCGKTTIIDAISFCLSDYKADLFEIKDMNTSKNNTNISVYSDNTFEVKTIYGNGSFKSIGYNFRANLRQKSTSIMFNSPIVKYQEYIAEDIEKYKPNSPDVRTSITNVYGFKRNNDTDFLYLEKNRVYQIKGGVYNDTKFDENVPIASTVEKPISPFQSNEKMKNFIDSIYGIKDTDRIFTITKSYLHHEMNRGVRASGVKRIRVHDLRHSHVSLLINMGFSAVAIGNRVGHESEKITYRYAHMFPTVQTEMAEKLDEEWEEGFDVTESI